MALCLTVSSAIPQVSVLGPLHFILYVNDVPRLTQGRTVMYNLVFKHPVALQCLHTISINNATIYSYFHYLTLNTTCFGRRWPSSGVTFEHMKTTPHTACENNG
jgi:hypothetical protein